MDVEALVAAVYSRKALWDRSHQHHHHRVVLDKLWIEVAKEMRLSVKDVRQKWKYLRDHFRKELKKNRNGQPSSGYEAAWPYFQLMSFLKDQINLKDKDDGSLQQDEESQLHTSVKLESDDFEVSDNEVSNDVDTSKRSFSGNDQANQKQEEPTATNKEGVCDDYHFFMSLVPMMKKFNTLQKMKIRTEFQQTVLEELSKMEEYQNS